MISSRKMDKTMLEFTKFLEKHASSDADDAEMQILLQQFNEQHDSASTVKTDPCSADDYLDLAEEAKSKKKRIEYLNKALELEPDNLTAGLMMVEATGKNCSEILDSLRLLIEKGDKIMARDGYFRDARGEFWLVVETRPYMRARVTYFETLVTMGMLHSAVEEGKKLIELCQDDNLGVRFKLMHVYAMLEDETAAKKLFRKYSDEYEESELLLPMTVLYYKLQKYDVAGSYLKRLMLCNKDTKKFVTAIVKGKIDEHMAELSPFGYEPFSFGALVEMVMENSNLYFSVPEFFTWALGQIKLLDGKKSSQKKNK